MKLEFKFEVLESDPKLERGFELELEVELELGSKPPVLGVLGPQEWGSTSVASAPPSTSPRS